MGCSSCRGHAHQVCSAPGCRDETGDIVERTFEDGMIKSSRTENFPNGGSITAYRLHDEYHQALGTGGKRIPAPSDGPVTMTSQYSFEPNHDSYVARFDQLKGLIEAMGHANPGTARDALKLLKMLRESVLK